MTIHALLGAHKSNYKQMDVCNTKLEFTYSFAKHFGRFELFYRGQNIRLDVNQKLWPS